MQFIFKQFIILCKFCIPGIEKKG